MLLLSLILVHHFEFIFKILNLRGGLISNSVVPKIWKTTGTVSSFSLQILVDALMNHPGNIDMPSFEISNQSY